MLGEYIEELSYLKTAIKDQIPAGSFHTATLPGLLPWSIFWTICGLDAAVRLGFGIQNGSLLSVCLSAGFALILILLLPPLFLGKQRALAFDNGTEVWYWLKDFRRYCKAIAFYSVKFILSSIVLFLLGFGLFKLLRLMMIYLPSNTGMAGDFWHLAFWGLFSLFLVAAAFLFFLLDTVFCFAPYFLNIARHKSITKAFTCSARYCFPVLRQVVVSRLTFILLSIPCVFVLPCFVCCPMQEKINWTMMKRIVTRRKQKR